MKIGWLKYDKPIPLKLFMLTEENLSLILLANMDLIYWSVFSSSRRGDWLKGVNGGIIILDSQNQ